VERELKIGISSSLSLVVNVLESCMNKRGINMIVNKINCFERGLTCLMVEAIKTKAKIK
jgi:hypothetical protein